MTVRTTDPQQTQIITNNDLTASKSAPSKLRKGAKSKYIVEEHPIVDGIGKVVRTRHTGDTYHCFFYVKDEQKWMRKSLHTKRLAEALEAGRKLIFQTLAKIDIGERVFAKTYKDVIDEHLEWKQKRADGKFITQGRVTTIRSTLKWAAKFAGGETKTINSKDGTEWSEYYVWRKSQKPDVKDATLVNERSMISELFKFADQKRYVTKRNIPIFDNTISKHKNVERRDAFNQREYNHLCNILQHFDKHAKNPKDRDYRKFIKDFFLISANTGIRFGEMRRLKWNQINILSKTDADGKPMCEIRLDIADTKNKKARIVQGMRGDFFSRIKEYSKFTRQSDYVFH
jgi:integrase